VEIQYQSGYMSTDLKPDFAGIHAHLALANIGPTTFMGDLASPGALRNLEEATFKGLKDQLGDAAADFTVKAENVDNTTATISMRGLYASFKGSLQKTDCRVR
jgi:hypothetical protein